MATTVVDKSINWQVPSVDDSEISVDDYQAMVSKADQKFGLHRFVISSCKASTGDQ
jgi:hypothetical protein